MPEKPPQQLDDAVPFVSNLVVLWRDNKLPEVFKLAQDEAQKAFDVFDLAFIRDTYEESFGKLVRAGELTAKPNEGGDLIIVEGPLVYENEKLTLMATLIRVEGELRWRGLDFKIPTELQKPPVDADGDAFARSIVDDMLAKKPQWAKFHPRLVDRNPADIDAQLAKLLAALGPIKSVGKPVDKTCETKAARCMTFPIVAKKKKANFDVELMYSGRVWRGASWNLRAD